MCKSEFGKLIADLDRSLAVTNTLDLYKERLRQNLTYSFQQKVSDYFAILMGRYMNTVTRPSASSFTS